MTIAYFCVVIMIFLPLICAAYAKFSVKGYNNRSPREFLDKLEGAPRRANYAQINTFESFAPFAAGVIAAHQWHAPQTTIDLLAVIFVVVRVLYAIFYIQDKHTLRSVVWFIGLIIIIGLFATGIKMQ